MDINKFKDNMKIKNIILLLISTLIALSIASCSGTPESPETTPPSIISKLPLPDATAVPINSNITVVFSESVNNVDNTTTTFTLTRLGESIPAAAVVLYNDSTKTAVLTPDSNLTPDSYYTVSLSGSITDKVGNAMSPVTWVFITGPSLDETPPTIVEKSPANEDGTLKRNVSIGIAISVKFSEPVTGVGENSFKLSKDSGGWVVPASVAYDSVTFTATLTPSNQLEQGTKYNITLTNAIVDTSGNILDNAPTGWQIETEDSTAPAVLSKAPANGSTEVGTTSSISVSFSESITGYSANTSVQIEKTSDHSPVTAVVTSYVDSTRTLTISPEGGSFAPDTQYTIKLNPSGSATITDTSLNHNVLANYEWSFTTASNPDNTGPSIFNKSPANNAVNVLIGSNITIEFSENAVGVSDSTVMLKKSSDSSYISTALTYNEATKTVTLDPYSDLEELTDYMVYVYRGITDSSGNGLTDTVGINPYTWTFRTGDTTPPAVSSKSPEGSSVATTAVIAVNFSEKVYYLSSSTVMLTRTSDSSVVAASVISLTDTSITLDPDGLLDQNTEYTVTVNPASVLINRIQDYSYNELPETSWNFTTTTNADITAPVVSSKSPDSGDSGIELNSNITIVFSESVQGANGSAIYLRKTSDNSQINSHVTYVNTNPFTATLNPDEDLLENTQYTVTVANSIKDQSNNQLDQSYSWNFTTKADTTPPAIVTKSPSSGSSTAKVSDNIIITFSEDVVNVSVSSFTLIRTSDSSAISAFVTYDSGTRSATLNPNVDLAVNTQYTVTLNPAAASNKIKDTAVTPNDLPENTWNFTTTNDSVQPVVIQRDTVNPITIPYEGQTGVSRDISNVVITFSEEMDPVKGTAYFSLSTDTVTPVTGTLGKGVWSGVQRNGTAESGSSIITLDYTGDIITGESVTGTGIPENSTVSSKTSNSVTLNNTATVSGVILMTFGNNRKITYPVIGRLSPGTAYAVRFIYWGGTFMDVVGNTINGSTYLTDSKLDFTTEGDSTPPSVINAIPAENSIVIKFNDQMNTAVGTAAVSGGITLGTVQWCEANTAAVYPISSGTLVPGTTYNITLTGYTDSGGNPLSGGTASFTTGVSAESLLSELFNSYSSPNFSSPGFGNVSGDNYDWDLAVSSKNPKTTPFEGTGMARAAALEWQAGDYAYLDMNSSALNFLPAGIYVLQFSLCHEKMYNASDRLAVFISTGGSYTQIGNDILRYDAFSVVGANTSVWHTHAVDLSSFAGQPSVRIRLKAISAGDIGNNILIDNLKIIRY